MKGIFGEVFRTTAEWVLEQAMASIERTAYPRLGKRLSTSELEAQYAITDEEARLVRRATNGDSPRLTFVTLLKTRQHPSRPTKVLRFTA